MSQTYLPELESMVGRCKEILTAYANGELDMGDIDDRIENEQQGTKEHAALTLAVATLHACGETD